jgi:hypothetical protein
MVPKKEICSFESIPSLPQKIILGNKKADE